MRFSKNSLKTPKTKTTFFITHRLGSVRMADRILVLKNGCLIEEGKHEELVSAEGEYANLFSLQAERYTLKEVSCELV
ncbi:MAG: hypothetical protein ACSNEK_10420 [Parachlamydiaceae bacterium]